MPESTGMTRVSTGIHLRMKKDTAYLTLARGTGPLISLLLIILLGRIRGPEDVGVFGIAMAVFAIAEAVTSMGMRHLLPRELAREPDAETVVAASLVCFSTGTVLALILTPAAAMVTKVDTASAILIVLAALPVSGLMVVAEGYWLARFRVTRIVRSLVAEHTIRVALGMVLLLAGHGVHALLVSFLIGRCTAYMFAIPDSGWRSPRFRTLQTLVGHVPPFIALELCFQAYWRVDVLLLGILSSARETGYYVVAYRLFSGLLLLPQSYGQILLPRLSIGRGGKLFRRSLRDMVLVGVGLLIVTRLAGHWLVGLLYGGGYGRSGDILLVLAIGFVWACIDQPQGRLLIARGRQLWDLSALAGALAANLILNGILIPRYGGVGAAWATVTSLLVSVAIHATGIYRRPSSETHET